MKNYLFLIIALAMLSTSCVKNKKGHTVTEQASTSEKVFEVKEIVQTSNYTYMKVSENFAERWVAVSKMDAKAGEKYYYDDAMLMNNFHSKELDRDFESIYFINKVSTVPMSMQEKIAAMPSSHSGKGEAPKSSVSLEKQANEITLAQVFEKRKDFANKEIEIRGIVVKVNKQVMGKNWIHIQDGTDHNGSFDLTITTQDIAEKGDEVTLKGTIILEKDFGAGYFYDVIMEDAIITDNKPATANS